MLQFQAIVYRYPAVTRRVFDVNGGAVTRSSDAPTADDRLPLSKTREKNEHTDARSLRQEHSRMSEGVLLWVYGGMRLGRWLERVEARMANKRSN